MDRIVVRFITVGLLCGLFSCPAVAQTQTASQGEPRAKVIEGVSFEPTASLLFLTPEQQRVAYRNVRLLAPNNLVARGPKVSELPQATMDFRDFQYEHEGRSRQMDDYLAENSVAGILVIQDGKIVLEKYAHGHNEDSVWVSFSIAKSVLSMMYGAALQDGSIKSLDDNVTKYVPKLKGSAYDNVTLKNLLQMSSGVAWNEDYEDRDSELVQSSRIGRTGGIEALLEYMKGLPRKAPAGTVYNYNTGETNVAGAILRGATGKSLAQYLSEKIWKPAGMQADAYWLLLREGDIEHGGCCISATLRDYGRLGLLALRKGASANGTQLFPTHWMTESTTPASTAPYYGYFWWLESGGRFAGSGIFGQYLHIDPERHIVVAMHSFWPDAWNQELPAHRKAFIQSLTAFINAKKK